MASMHEKLIGQVRGVMVASHATDVVYTAVRGGVEEQIETKAIVGAVEAELLELVETRTMVHQRRVQLQVSEVERCVRGDRITVTAEGAMGVGAWTVHELLGAEAGGWATVLAVRPVRAESGGRRR